MKILAIYPGRFQPFHKGHKQVYEWLKQKFGNAVIATSDKVDPPKSPFNFAEKVELMNLAGVPSSDIKEVKNPYIATEILASHNENDTIIVFAVSEKDMAEDPRFSFTPTKSGKPRYLQPFPKSGKGLKPFGDPNKPTGYVIVTPTFTFDVLGEPMKSATEVRKQFAEADYDTQAKLIKDLFGKYSKKVHNLMIRKIAANTKPKTIADIRAKAPKKLKEECGCEDVSGDLTHDKFGPMLDTFVQFASDKLGIKSLPTHELSKKEMTTSFASYNPSEKHVSVITKNRHPMDIFRSVAHELVHHKQNEDGRLGKDIAKEGATGSDIENEANSEAGKIMRWFAKANPSMFKSGYVTESYIDEGIQDPSKMKAVILGGGPGSGKDWIAGRLGLIAKKNQPGFGLTEINSDNALEHMMKMRGLSLKMPKEEEPERNIVRGRAKNVSREKERLALAGRRGVLINGTADDPEKIARIKKELEDLGYETKMLFVNTRNDVSRERNIERGQLGGRKVPDGTNEQGVPDNSPDIRTEKWVAAQEARKPLKKMFGDEHFIEVDNSDDYRQVGEQRKKEIDKMHNALYKHYNQFLATPTKTPKAAEWIEKEKQKRGISQYTPARATKVSQRQQRPQQQYVPNASELEQAKRLGVSHLGGGQFGRSKDEVSHVSKNGQLVMAEEKGSLSLKNWFDRSRSSKTGAKGWVQVGGKYSGYPCARQPGQTTTPKCRSSEEASTMSKKEKEYAFRAKQRKDPNQPEKSGAAKPTMVKTYKNQNESVSIQEVKDACYQKVKSRYKVWPSAYASGALVKCRKVGASNWGNKSEQVEVNENTSNKPSEREWGKTSLRNIYARATPGQIPEEDKIRDVDGTKSSSMGSTDSNYMGPTAGPGNAPGGLGSGYSIHIYESVLNWMTNERTIERFIQKYGDLAEERLAEVAMRLNEMETGADMGMIPKQGTKEEIPEDWQSVNRRDRTDGLSQKAVNAYRRENPGSKLQTAVTEKNPKGKRAKRRLSFCRRMSGMKKRLTSAKTANDPDSRINKALRRWNC
jgi:cytidyltransferase-like protein